MNTALGNFAVQLLPFGLGLIVSFGLPWLLWRRLRSRRPSTAPRPIDDDGSGGKVIPLYAAFTGIRGLPWVGFATNNLNPRLVITPIGIVYRVVALRTRSYAAIKQVDVQTFGATVNVGFAFRDTPLTFEANVGNLELAAQVINLLGDHVDLSDRARALLA